MSYKYTNILGSFLFDEKGGIIEKAKSVEKPDENKIKLIMQEFKKPEYTKRFHDLNLELTKSDIKKSLPPAPCA